MPNIKISDCRPETIVIYSGISFETNGRVNFTPAMTEEEAAMHDQRAHYRKNLHTTGRIEIDGKEQGFVTEDISVKGIRIHIQSNHLLDEDLMTTIYLDQLDAMAQAEIVWVMPYILGGTFIGLKFTDVEGTADKLRKTH
ncbi:MAG: PilZ domain-containing protein [Pseudomonadota bacterium]